MSLRKISNVLNAYVGAISTVSAYAAAYCLLLMMFFVALHVFMRYFFGLPISGAVELIEFTMVFVVFLGFGYSAYKDINVAVEVLMEHMPETVQHCTAILMNLLGIVIVSCVAWQGAVQAVIIETSKQMSGVLHIPQYPFFWILVAGYIVFDLALLNNIVKHLVGMIQ